MTACFGAMQNLTKSWLRAGQHMLDAPAMFKALHKRTSRGAVQLHACVYMHYMTCHKELGGVCYTLTRMPVKVCGVVSSLWVSKLCAVYTYMHYCAKLVTL